MKIYNEMGQLTEDGKKATHDLKEMVKGFLSDGKDESEVRMIGSILTGIVAETASNMAVGKK